MTAPRGANGVRLAGRRRHHPRPAGRALGRGPGAGPRAREGPALRGGGRRGHRDAAGPGARAARRAGRGRLLAARLPDPVRRRQRRRRVDHRLRDARDGRPLAAGEVRRPVGAVRRRDPAPRHRAASRRLPARPDQPRPARLLRDDRDRARLGRRQPAHHGHVRPGHGRVRHPHPGPVGAQGVHRQRGAGRPAGRRSSPSWSPTASRRACTRSSSRSATSTARAMPGVRIEDCGLKAGLNGVDNGRLYFDNVRVPRDNLLNRYGDVAARRHATPRRSRTRRSGSSPCSARSCRAGSASPAAPAAPPRSRSPSRSATASARRQFAGAGRHRDPRPRLPGPPAQAAARPGQVVRTALRAARTGGRAARDDRRPRRAAHRPARASIRTGASSSPAPPASRRSRRGTPRARSRPAGRPAAGPATSPRTGCPG